MTVPAFCTISAADSLLMKNKSWEKMLMCVTSIPYISWAVGATVCLLWEKLKKPAKNQEHYLNLRCYGQDWLFHSQPQYEAWIHINIWLMLRLRILLDKEMKLRLFFSPLGCNPQHSLWLVQVPCTSSRVLQKCSKALLSHSFCG